MQAREAEDARECLDAVIGALKERERRRAKAGYYVPPASLTSPAPAVLFFGMSLPDLVAGVRLPWARAGDRHFLFPWERSAAPGRGPEVQK